MAHRRQVHTPQAAAEQVYRAAGLQMHQCGLSSVIDEARRLASEYSIPRKQNHWQEYGDVAFHLLASYPPDLAYAVLYSLRETQLNYDPVPLLLKATEHIYHLRPELLQLHVRRSPQVQTLFDNPSERARQGAKILAREVAVTPFRWACGVYHEMDNTIKPFVTDHLATFDPHLLKMLSGSRIARFLTVPGILRPLLRLFFGRNAA